ncbi:MAG: tetratricopeptide repeat protein [Lentisphaerae bacterium]|nr:tetratricopeptide repeat protein [Lentisphaerota bacterium]
MMVARKGVVGLGLLLVVLTPLMVVAQAVDYAAAAAKAQKEGDLGAVNRLCNDWIEAKPRDDRPRLILGRIYLRPDRDDQAVEQFELAAEANPLSSAPRCEIGNVFLKAHRYDEAIKEYDQALRVNRRCVPAFVGKARAKLAQGAPDAALAETLKAQQYGPDDASASAVLGEALLAVGSVEEALAAVRKATKLDTQNADAWYGLGFCLDSLDRVDDAQDAWKRFLELEPDGERAVRVRNRWVVLETKVLYPELKSKAKCPTVSPDGRHIAFAVYSRGIFRAPFPGDDEPLEVTPCPAGWNQIRVSWSPDGREVLYYEHQLKQRLKRVKYVSAAGGHEPTIFTVPGVEGLGYSAWSPSGKEILAGSMPKTALDVATGETRKILVRNEAGKALYSLDADYMPSGRELITTAALPGKRYQLYRVALDSGKAVAKLFDFGDGALCGSVVIAPDGFAVAVTMYKASPDVPRPLLLLSTAVPGVGVRVGLNNDGWSNPGWFPEGRRILARVGEWGHDRMSIIRLGGLDSRPIGITSKRAGDGALSAVVASKLDVAQTASFRWEAFDDQSLRLGPGVESETPVELKPGERVEWPIQLTPEQAKGAVTVKVTVLNQDGVGAVKLVDWVAPSAR